MDDKKRTLIYPIVSGAVIVVLASGLCVVGKQISDLKTQMTAISDFSSDGSNIMGETTEDDVTIAEDYEIRSTKQISDAYLAGDTSSLSKEDQETCTMASEILDEITTADMSDYEKEKAVYDWMTTNITTDEGTMTVINSAAEGVDNPHYVLKNKKAVCVGYATTFRLFMQMMGIDCKVVHNVDCYHSWDEVCLDGDWYITDVYSDDGFDNYAHFNVTGEQYSESTAETWDTEYFPAATGTKYNMAYQEAVAETDIYSIPKYVSEMQDQGKNMVSLLFPENLDEESQNAVNLMMEMISGRLDYAEETDENTVSYLQSSLMKVDTGYLFSCYLFTTTYDDTDESSDVSDETMQKINDAVDQYFETDWTEDGETFEEDMSEEELSYATEEVDNN